MCLLTDYLLNTDTSVYEYFDRFIYNQIVKSKTKSSNVEIINADDFFKKLSNAKIDPHMKAYLTDEIKEELKTILCLDKNF